MDGLRVSKLTAAFHLGVNYPFKQVFRFFLKLHIIRKIWVILCENYVQMHLNVFDILTYPGILSPGKGTCTLPDTSRRGSLSPIGPNKKKKKTVVYIWRN